MAAKSLVCGAMHAIKSLSMHMTAKNYTIYLRFMYESEYCTAFLSLRGLTDPTVSCSPTDLCICLGGPHTLD
jgi:hypothetical protein